MTTEPNDVLCRQYLDWLSNTKGRTGGTIYNYASVLTPFLEFLADRPAGDVKLHELEAHVQRPRGGRARGGTASAATQQKDVTIIRGWYSYLVSRGVLHSNPAALLGAPKVSNQNPRPIPDDDWNALWAAARPGVERVFLGLGFFVGLRRREICELRPEQVFGKRGLLVNFKRKGGGDDVTPYEDLCEIIQGALPRLQGAGDFPALLGKYARQRVGHGFLIEWGETTLVPQREVVIHQLPEGATDPNLLNKRMNTVCALARAPHYTPHQLRHSFVSNLLRAGVPLHLVSRMANHSSPAITSRYIKAGASELREWMATVNRHS